MVERRSGYKSLDPFLVSSTSKKIKLTDRTDKMRDTARYGMDTLEERNPLAYSPSWNPAAPTNTPGGPFLSFPSSRAGDLPSTIAPNRSGLHSGLSNPKNVRSEIFNSDLGFQDVTHAPMIAVPARQGGPNSRPQFDQSRSHPHGTYGSCKLESRYYSHTDTLIGIPAGHISSRNNESVSGVGFSPLTNQPKSPANSILNMDGHINTMYQPMVPQSDHPSTVNIKKARMDSQARIPQQGITTDESGSFPHQPALPMWEASLRFLTPTGPVDSILIGLLQRQRSLAHDETIGSIFIGPYHPDLRALVNPELSNQVHPVSSIISNLFQRLPYPSLAEKVAVLFLVYHFCQWQIWPTMETYNNIPEWLRPRASQLATAHPIWSTLVSFLPTENSEIANSHTADLGEGPRYRDRKSGEICNRRVCGSVSK